MDRVASTVGLATGSLYNYFEDKNDLLQFFYTRLVEPFFEPIEEIATTELPAPQKLEKILRTAWEHAVKNKCLIRLFVGGDQRAEIRRDTRPRFQRILTAIFEQGIREGSFGAYNPAHMARMFQGCLSELFDLLAEGATERGVERVRRTADRRDGQWVFHPVKRQSQARHERPDTCARI